MKKGEEMKNGLKLMAIATAFMMMAVAGFVILNQTEGSDAAPQSVTSNVTFHIYDTTAVTPAWVDATASGYDAYQALGALTGVTHTVTNSSAATTTTPNSSWNIGIYSAAYDWTYYYPNAEYGQLATVNGAPATADSGYEWKVYIYSKASSTATNDTWGNADVTLGWIQPFEDYLAVNSSGRSLASANVALIYCSVNTADTVNTAMIANHVSTYTGLTQIDKTHGSAFEMTFYIQGTNSNITVNPSITVTKPNYTTQTLTVADINNGIIIVGYGSSAITALNDALSSTNINISDQAPFKFDQSGNRVYYSWFESMFGVGDAFTAPSTWNYWSTYEYGSGSQNYCAYSLGYYSTLVGGYNYSADFDLIYV